MSEGSLGFIYSEKLFHKELSPLEFLSTKLIGGKQNENPQIYQGKILLVIKNKIKITRIKVCYRPFKVVNYKKVR